ncbi:hypothetical protein, partial [Pseudomonas viridiflava]|uniref:hypothetical protein n=1 Tax=Pseudomonas viridiflava TaxID=33069 RepID=UPI001981F3E4
LVRECSISATAYAPDVLAFSRTSPLPQNPVSSVVYRLFDKSGLVRECSIPATAYTSDVPAFSRTNGTPPGPLPQNRVSSVGCRLFDNRRLAGDAVDAVCQETASSFIAGKPQWITRG